MILLLFSQALSQNLSFHLEFAPTPSLLKNFGGKRVVLRPKLGLALSGGGARGFAQIGILRVLEREDIPIACIAGTSMGGIIGGLYAAGYSAADLEKLATTLNWQDLFTDTPPRLSLLQPQREESEGALFQIRWDGLKPHIPAGLTSAQKLTNLFADLTFQADYFSGSKFDHLKIPFRSVTTDLVSGQKIVLDSGELALALRATMAVPLAITPVPYQKMLLVDGGLVDPVPVEVVKQMGADLVLAVNTSAALLSQEKIKDPLDIASQSASIMTLHKRKESLQAADLVIEPNLTGFSSTDFAQAESLIQIGERIADSLLPDIRRLLETEPNSETYRLERIEFRGNQLITQDSLENWLGLEVPALISTRQIYYALASLYQRGYFQEVYAEVDSAGGETSLVVHLLENPQVQEIAIQNNSQASTNQASTEMTRLMWSNPHSRIFNFQEVNKVLDSKLKELREKGSSLARFTAIEYQPESERLVASLDEGVISEITISGNRRTRDWIVESNFPLKKGDCFNLRLAQKGLSNLQSSGYFDQVSLGLASTERGPLLSLNLKENKFYVLRGGLHFWDEYHLEGFAESGYTNLLGTGNQIFLRAAYGDRRENYSLVLKANRIFKTYLTYLVSWYYRTEESRIFSDHKERGSFKEIRRGGKFSLGHNLARLGKASFEFQTERVLLDNPSGGLVKSENKRSLSFKILFDNLDSYPYPQQGNYNQLNLEVASKILGGEISYRKLYTSLETYLPITDRFNLHPHLWLGYSDRSLPLYEKFALGGKENFYGFYSEEKRGDRTWLVSLEFRLRTARRVYWFARYDVGDIWDHKVSLHELKQGLGLKLGITTPLGPIELAYGLNSLGFEKVYFTFGFQF